MCFFTPCEQCVKLNEAPCSFHYSGYEGLIKNLMSELPRGVVTYNQPVRCVNWNNTERRRDPVTVECDDGKRIDADHVIVTVPLGSVTLVIKHYIC